MAAGREHRQSDRAGNSSWMERSLQKEGRGADRGRTEHFGQGKILLQRYCSTSTTTTLPQNVSVPKEVCLCFYFNPRRNLRPLFRRSCFLLQSLSFWQFSQCHHSHTLTLELVVRRWWFNFIYFLLMAKAGQQLLQDWVVNPFLWRGRENWERASLPVFNLFLLFPSPLRVPFPREFM